MDPNMATDVSRPATVVSLKLRSRKSAIGMIGSAVCRSTCTKATAETTVAAMRARITGLVQS